MTIYLNKTVFGLLFAGAFLLSPIHAWALLDLSTDSSASSNASVQNNGSSETRTSTRSGLGLGVGSVANVQTDTNVNLGTRVNTGGQTTAGFRADERSSASLRTQTQSRPFVSRNSDNRLRTNLGTQLSQDARIQSQVNQTLLAEPSLRDRGISADVQGGVVRLKGRVSSGLEKDLATRLAKNIRGTQRVSNELSVDSNLRAETSGKAGII